MKLKRGRQTKRILTFYKNNFGFREPFQILVDGTFGHAAIKQKIHIKEHLEKNLTASVTLYTTKCIVQEVKLLGPDFFGTYVMIRKFEYRQCKHAQVAPARECVLSFLDMENKHRLFFATQDPELRRELREFSGVPLLFFSRSLGCLETPSTASFNVVKERHRKLGLVSDKEKESLGLLKKPLSMVRSLSPTFLKNLFPLKIEIEKEEIRKPKSAVVQKIQSRNNRS
jgi:U3 small nucleolar RNA-associated protein 23